MARDPESVMSVVRHDCSARKKPLLGYHSIAQNNISHISSFMPYTILNLQPSMKPLEPTNQTSNHPTILQILQHLEQILRTPARNIVILEVWQWNPAANGFAVFACARGPVVFDVGAGGEGEEEEERVGDEGEEGWEVGDGEEEG